MTTIRRAASFVSAGAVALFLAACATDGGGGAGAPSRDVAGSSWMADAIGGAPIIGERPVTLNFGENYRVNGNSGCNQFFGVYTRERDYLAFAGVGATEMACAPELMAQEEAFFSILNGVERYSIGADGRLTLHAEDGRTLAFAPAGS